MTNDKPAEVDNWEYLVSLAKEGKSFRKLTLPATREAILKADERIAELEAERAVFVGGLQAIAAGIAETRDEAQAENEQLRTNLQDVYYELGRDDMTRNEIANICRKALEKKK